MIKLTPAQHREAAQLLKQAQEHLDAACRLINRTPYTDRVLYASGVIQEWLVDPLSTTWDDAHPEEGYRDNPYPHIYYSGPHRRRLPPKMR